MRKTHLSSILEGAPNNWGRWGNDDEIGALNFLTSDEVLRGIEAVEEGKAFTLGRLLFTSIPGPRVSTRSPPLHHMMVDKGHYEAGKAGSSPSERTAEFTGMSESAVDAYSRTAGLEMADDSAYLFLHEGTHMDALGHAWYGEELYNGTDAETTKGGLEHGDVAPLAEHGIFGRGILFDIPHYRGVDYLEPGDRITSDELENCAEEQSVSVQEHDIVLIRTGWIERYYEEGPAMIDLYDEPGLTADEEVLNWFHTMEIPLLGTDTLRNEQTISDETGTFLPLHAAFLRNLGILLNEALKLDRLAAYCAEQKKYDFLFVNSPLKLKGATASPVNPIAIL